MPPAAKKDCSVILFDLKAKHSAKQALVKICLNSYFSQSKDLTKLILLNSSVTDNALNARYGGYDNINEVAKDVTIYNPELFLESIEKSKTADANWLEGLHVALKNAEEEFEQMSGIVTRQILFLTDLETPLVNYDKKIIDKIQKSVKKLNAFLYIVGPKIDVPFTIKNDSHVKKWMKDFSPETENLKILKNVLSGLENSVVCDYKIGVHLFFAFRNWANAMPWLVPLEIGSKIQIPAKTIKILEDDVKCKLKKVQGTLRPATWIDAEDETVEIDLSDVIQGLSRHEKFIQMPDNKMFQVENPRSFSVLCFTDSKNVPEYLMRGEGCYKVFPNNPPEQNEAFSILVDILAKQNKYIIARRIYNANGGPKIVVLVPKPDHKPKCFLMVMLPFSENIRVNYREQTVDSAPKVEISEHVYDFLDSINIEDEKASKKFPLGINMMQDYRSQKIVNKGADKFLDKHMALGDIDLPLLESPRGPEFEALKKLWPERVLKEEKIKKADVDDEGSDNDFDW